MGASNCRIFRLNSVYQLRTLHVVALRPELRVCRRGKWRRVALRDGCYVRHLCRHESRSVAEGVHFIGNAFVTELVKPTILDTRKVWRVRVLGPWIFNGKQISISLIKTQNTVGSGRPLYLSTLLPNSIFVAAFHLTQDLLYSNFEHILEIQQ